MKIQSVGQSAGRSDDHHLGRLVFGGMMALLHAAEHRVRLLLIRLLKKCVIDDSLGHVARRADQTDGLHKGPPIVIGKPLACRYSRMLLRLSSSILCPA